MKILIINQHTLNFGDDIAGISLIQNLLKISNVETIDVIYNTKGKLPFDDTKVIHNQDIMLKEIGMSNLIKYFCFRKLGKKKYNEPLNKMIKIINEADYIFVSPCGANIGIYKDWRFLVKLLIVISENKKAGIIKNVKIVANLPYYITTPIIMKLLEEKLDIESITVMIQKEVADRLIEIPGGKNTGAITHTVYYYCESEKIMEVPNSSFIPEPEVTSEVIKMKLRKAPAVKIENSKVMFMVIKSAFMQRRKTLLNALTNTKVFVSKEEGTQILKTLNLNENVRAEELSLQDFANITKMIMGKEEQK